MKLEQLVQHLKSIADTGYAYLATVYSVHPEGPEKAFTDACRAACWCLRHGIVIFCPIVHSHPLEIMDPALHGHKVWLPADQPLMQGACGMIVTQMPLWETSYGISYERNYFYSAGKPIGFLPWPLPEA
jgi:hypothetical protein